MTTTEHTPGHAQTDLGSTPRGPRRSRPAGPITLSRTIALVTVTALVGSASAALGASGGSETSTATTRAGVELVTNGGAPRFVTISQTSAGWRFQPGVDGLAELRWGQGGRPVVVPLGTSR